MVDKLTSASFTDINEKTPKKDIIEVPVGDFGVQEESMRLKTGGRYTKDRKDKKTGRKGRKQKPFNLLEE